MIFDLFDRLVRSVDWLVEYLAQFRKIRFFFQNVKNIAIDDKTVLLPTTMENSILLVTAFLYLVKFLKMRC